MQKIIYVANQRLPTEKAYGSQIAKMCEAFADSGASLELLVPTRHKSNIQNIFEYYGLRRNFTVKSLRSPDFYWPGSLDKIAFLIKQWVAAMKLSRVALSSGADVVYSRDEFPIFLASFFSRRPQLVFEAHKFSSHRSRYYRRFNKAGVKIIAISKGIRDAFIAFGYMPESVFVAHDGVDTDRFTVDKSKVECRSLLGLPQDKKIALYAGHLYEWKGAHILAESARNLDEQYRVIFIGGIETDVADYKKKYSSQSNVLFLGRQPHVQVPLYLKAADVLVLPNSGKEDISRLYTSPLKMFEYMTSGNPIIASDLPSIREVLSDENAFFFPSDDPVALASTIQMVLDSPRDSQERARKALDLVRGYTWLCRAHRILEFI